MMEVADLQSKLVALCDGHGMETAGKRTPVLPDGTVMRENEFNRAVVAKLDRKLKTRGFKTVLVAPGDKDVPLSQRVRTANNDKADIYVSIHANAAGTGYNSGRGIETFCYKFGGQGEKLARAVHAQLTKGTKQKNRGVKEGNFQVIRETEMPAILVEAAFMTNLEEAKLLMNDSYREEVAEEVYRGICDYYKVPYLKKGGELPMGESAVFTDIVGRWSQGDIEYLEKRGIIKCGGDGKFRPADTITREEVAALIARAIKYVKGEK